MAPEQPEPVIWMWPERAATGRPATRSRAGITAAALGLADREGLAAVSMRRVATGLGTGGRPPATASPMCCAGSWLACSPAAGRTGLTGGGCITRPGPSSVAVDGLLA